MSVLREDYTELFGGSLGKLLESIEGSWNGTYVNRKEENSILVVATILLTAGLIQIFIQSGTMLSAWMQRKDILLMMKPSTMYSVSI